MNIGKGYQKTRLLLAVELCKVVFDIVDADPNEKDIVEQTKKIKEQIKLCEPHLDINLSAGARREYESKIKILNEYIIEKDKEGVYFCWACLAYACADLVFDCKIGCPTYFTEKPFFSLLEALEYVQEILCTDIENLDRYGTELYSKLSID